MNAYRSILQPKGHVPQAQLSPMSDEYVLDLLGQCEQKLLKLMDDLGGKDIEDILKEDTEVWQKLYCCALLEIKYFWQS